MSFDRPLLVVLFFHGREDDPRNFAWKGHRLPDQLAASGRNAILIAPTMRMSSSNNVVFDYLTTHDRIATLVRDRLSAVGQHLGLAGDGSSVDPVIKNAGLLLVGFSNGYLAWSEAVKTLLSPRPETSTVIAPPAAIGHSLFDCLYWSTPLMNGVDPDAPAADARFSKKGRAILESSFVTTHFTSTNETLNQGKYLTMMIARDATLRPHDDVPASLGFGDIVKALLPTSKHLEAVSCRRELSRVIAASAGFDLAAGPAV